ncbi:MAG: response regulator [Mesorhizobium sp.]|nr:MAG: response regulator [Mesorhizobium sp.]
MPLPSDQKSIVHVVDDDASMREALHGLFLSIGLETRTYASAQDFLATAVPDSPGCLIIDVRLPDMNGLDFQAQLSQTGVQLPVVMMTGYGDIPMSVIGSLQRHTCQNCDPTIRLVQIRGKGRCVKRAPNCGCR